MQYIHTVAYRAAIKRTDYRPGTDERKRRYTETRKGQIRENCSMPNCLDEAVEQTKLNLLQTKEFRRGVVPGRGRVLAEKGHGISSC